VTAALSSTLVPAATPVDANAAIVQPSCVTTTAVDLPVVTTQATSAMDTSTPSTPSDKSLHIATGLASAFRHRFRSRAEDAAATDRRCFNVSKPPEEYFFTGEEFAKATEEYFFTEVREDFTCARSSEESRIASKERAGRVACSGYPSTQ